MAELIAVPITVPVRISSSVFKSHEELMAERTANLIISLSAKIALLLIDPKRRPPLPKREEVIDFLEFMDGEAERNIHAAEHSLKYFQ